MNSSLDAKQAITEALYRYARAMDRIDPELAKTVWHPDATVDYGQIFRLTAIAMPLKVGAA